LRLHLIECAAGTVVIAGYDDVEDVAGNVAAQVGIGAPTIDLSPEVSGGAGIKESSK
jgi:hypothetical protein